MDGVMWRCVGVDGHGWCDVGGCGGVMWRCVEC